MQFRELKYQDIEIWCAIYCRLSQEDRNKEHEIDDSVSIQNQKSMLISYAEANGWKIYKVYVDDDYAGADRSRPAFNELLQDAEDKKFQIVLCKSQSRFTRELELVEKYLHGLFPLWGIRFVGVVDNADTENKGNKKARQINGLVNEWYLEDLSENIKGVLTDRRQKGYHIGAFAAYGYQKDPEKKGHLIPDPEAASIVHWIFEMYAAGMGKTNIARKLNEEGIPNPTAYKLAKGIRKKKPQNMRTSLWQYFVIAEILANEVYIGHMVQGKYGSVSYKTKQSRPRPKEEWIRVLYTHAPIIEKELWDKVQSIREKRTKPGWTGEVGMFARKAKCMYCGYSMRSKKLVDGRKYLACTTHEVHKNVCIGGHISVKELEGTILVELRKLVNEYLDMDAAEEQMILRDEQKEKIATLKKELESYKNKIENTDNAIKTLYLDRVQGVITPEEFSMLSEEFKADKMVCEKRVEEVQHKIELLKAQKTEELSKRQILEECAQIQELNYDIVNTLIEFVEIGKREGHYKNGKVPVVIHWRF